MCCVIYRVIESKYRNDDKCAAHVINFRVLMNLLSSGGGLLSLTFSMQWREERGWGGKGSDQTNAALVCAKSCNQAIMRLCPGSLIVRSKNQYSLSHFNNSCTPPTHFGHVIKKVPLFEDTQPNV